MQYIEWGIAAKGWKVPLLDLEMISSSFFFFVAFRYFAYLRNVVKYKESGTRNVMQSNLRTQPPRG